MLKEGLHRGVKTARKGKNRKGKILENYGLTFSYNCIHSHAGILMTLKKTRSITMKPVRRFSSIWAVAFALAAFIGISSTHAEQKMNKAIVRSVRGTGGGPGVAQYSADKGSTWQKLNVGKTLYQGSVIKTAPGSVVDLFLGDNGPVVRVTEDTIMGVDKLTSEGTGAEKVIETQLDLRNGRILGNVKKLAQASKYEVKTPMGVAGIRGTQYDISANGKVTVIEGVVVVVYIIPGQPPQTVTVNAGQTSLPPNGNIPAQVVNTPNIPVIDWNPPAGSIVIVQSVQPISSTTDPGRNQKESTATSP